MKTWCLVVGLMGAIATTLPALAQDPVMAEPPEFTQMLREFVVAEDGSQSLVIDNTRTKIGRDFYDAFYREWANNTPTSASNAGADTSQAAARRPFSLEMDAILLNVDELPSQGTGTIVSITMDDQIIWQNFLQARLDVIEAYASDAVMLVREFVANYTDNQQQLNGADQRGSGIR